MSPLTVLYRGDEQTLQTRAQIAFLKVFFFLNYVCTCVAIGCVNLSAAALREWKRASDPGAGITAGHQPPDVGAGSQS